MTQLLGTIVNATGVPLDGTLTVSLPTIVIDDSTSPDTIYTEVPESFEITAGEVDIDLPETQTYEIPYNLTFVETGETAPLFSIDAVVANVNVIQLASFFPTGITSRSLDTSALRVSRLIATDETLSQLVKQPAVFSVNAAGITAEQKYFMPKPFTGAIRARSLTVLGISGYEDWDFELGVLNSSGNEDELNVGTTSTQTENGRRRIHQTYDISRAASVMGLFVKATPQSGASALTATLSISYTEI